MRRLALTFAILLAGCAGPDLRPSVAALNATIQAWHRDDYQAGRVLFSDDPEKQALMLEARAAEAAEAEALAREAAK